MSAAMEVARRGIPYQVNAGLGDQVRCVEEIDGECVEQDMTVLDVQEHGYFIWLTCKKEDGHVHRVQLFRDGKPSHGTVVSLRIVERISPPDWEPVKPSKDPAVSG